MRLIIKLNRSLFFGHTLQYAISLRYNQMFLGFEELPRIAVPTHNLMKRRVWRLGFVILHSGRTEKV